MQVWLSQLTYLSQAIFCLWIPRQLGCVAASHLQILKRTKAVSLHIKQWAVSCELTSMQYWHVVSVISCKATHLEGLEAGRSGCLNVSHSTAPFVHKFSR